MIHTYAGNFIQLPLPQFILVYGETVEVVVNSSRGCMHRPTCERKAETVHCLLVVNSAYSPCTSRVRVSAWMATYYMHGFCESGLWEGMQISLACVFPGGDWSCHGTHAKCC